LKAFRQNIIIYLLSAAVLFTGNFALAVTHLDCIMEEEAHHKCEMECCAQSDCCESETNEQGAPEITAEGCCEVHIEQAVHQDYTLPLISKNPDKLKYEIAKSGISSECEFKTAYFSLVTHQFKTTNIYLSVSNLRI
jgi:hypothetical protein